MDAASWAETAINAWAPWLDPERVGRLVDADEAWAVIRALYIDGYLDGLNGADAPADPCAAATRLLLEIPV